MKKLIYTLLCALFFSVAIYAQPRMKIDAHSKNLGEINWQVPILVRYEITNSGDKPLVISNVTTSCACNALNWTKQPIMPKAKGFINVVFDAKALGRFNKSLSVYCNAEPYMFQLRFAGIVAKEPKQKAKQMKYKIAHLGLDKNVLDFGDVRRGAKSTIELTVQNDGATDYEPVIMHKPRYMTVEKTKEVIRVGEQGVLRITIDTDKLNDWGLKNTKVYLSRFIGDRVGYDNALPIKVVVLPSDKVFSKLTNNNTPVVNLSSNELSIKGLPNGKTTQYVMIRNSGKGNLDIIKMQVIGDGVGIDLKKKRIPSATEVKLKAKLDVEQIRKSAEKPYILMITNDPENPKTIISIVE